ncbi:MAG: hypothetical protein ABTQ24_04205 [Azonexus sp.]|jgi:hypothetical protein
MRTCRKFAHFDPLTGEVPYWPYPELGDSVGRARRLLSKCSHEEIHHLASVANDVITEYFALALHLEVSRLLTEGREDFLDVDAQGWILGIDPERVAELDFPRPENTSEADALQADSTVWPDVFGETPSVQVLSRCLAALALAHVGDAIHRLHYQYDFEKLEYVHQQAKKLQPYDYIVSGQAALAAMAAVDRAERLLEGRGVLEAADEHPKPVTPPASTEGAIAEEQMSSARPADGAERRIEHARHMAAQSLRNRNASREAVLAEWDRDRALQGLSRAKAGLRLSQWLARQDLEFFEPRTVAAWIAVHEKSLEGRR